MSSLNLGFLEVLFLTHTNHLKYLPLQEQRSTPFHRFSPTTTTGYTGSSELKKILIYHIDLPDRRKFIQAINSPPHPTLLAYWIKRLKREKEEYLQTYKPSPHDLLSYNKKLQQALDKIRTRKEAELDYQIAFNALLREHRATLASNNTAASTDTATNKTIVPNYLNQPIKIITTPFLTGKTLTTTNTNEDSTANNDNLEDLIDYEPEDPSLLGYSPHQRELNDKTAPSQTLTKRVKALKVSRIQPIRQETPVLMEIDNHSPSQEATRSPQTSTEDNL
ncbi:hypothetical protein PCASD_00767 [Puccinia coronata f. sp. avenae]|uniref:Uncharacterized protein n=1 Tax=Puccinia coronata f. sp. avenae TaxID=200324 RepID=A0A2N5VL85_9BASI|nr:hypothetical protein PCASD_00767 [Puccinia coronata f. sp. avenae]